MESVAGDPKVELEVWAELRQSPVASPVPARQHLDSAAPGQVTGCWGLPDPLQPIEPVPDKRKVITV